MILRKSTIYLPCMSHNRYFIRYYIRDAYHHLFIECSKTYLFHSLVFRHSPFIDSEFSTVGCFLLTSCDIFPHITQGRLT
ncbi:hypothetical protein DWG93_18685 [Escherichia coli]|nr:hypothetical protein [Escherichia coli]EFO1629736.1 hypothetical protein [Escherichia coli]